MSVSDAYWAGYNDYCKVNPYDSETNEYAEWESGWKDAAWATKRWGTSYPLPTGCDAAWDE